jgi:hypothetical protein
MTIAVIMQQLANASSDLAKDSSALEASISALKSCISALDSSINSLEGKSGFWEALGWWSAIAVGIGVAGELAVIFHEYLDEKRDWARGIMRPPDHPSRSWLWFDVFSTLVVLVGIFFEAGASAKLSSINEQLRSKTSALRGKSDQLLALVTQQAGSAAQSAVIANKAAGEAKGEADTVGRRADALTLQIEGAEKKAADLDRQLSRTAGTLAYTLQRTERLQEELSWRTVSPMVKTAIKGYLAPYVPGHSPYGPALELFRGRAIEMKCLAEDSEAWEYSDELVVALREALDGSGAVVSDTAGVFLPGKPPTGVVIQNSSDSEDAAYKLREAIGTFADEVQRSSVPIPKSNTIIIFVGFKPRPKLR